MRNYLLMLLGFAVFFYGCRKSDSMTDDTSAGTVQTTIVGVVTDESGKLLSGVTIRVGSNTIQSDKDGFFLLEDITVPASRYYLRASASNYMESGFGGIAVKDGVTSVEIRLLSMGAARTVSGATSGTTDFGGTKLSFESNSFIRQDGSSYSGTVSVYARALSPDQTGFAEMIPGGDLSSRLNDGSSATLVSYGMAGVELRDNANNELKLASGKQAEIRFPIAASQLSSAPAEIPLWSFDEATGEWKQEGKAMKVGNEYVGKVGHFSWWNCDIPNQTCRIRGRVVDCAGRPIAGARVVVNGQYSLVTDVNGFYDRTAPRIALRFEVKINGVAQTLANVVTLSNPRVGLNQLQDIRVGAVGNCPTYVVGKIDRCGSSKKFLVNIILGASREGWNPILVQGDTFRVTVPSGRSLTVRLSSTGGLVRDTVISPVTIGQTLDVGQLSGCEGVPRLRTTAIGGVGPVSATSGGEVTFNGGSPITVRGVCWGTSPNPTIANAKTSNGTGMELYSSSLTGLMSNTRYYVRAYATNARGTGYGNELSFTTLASSITALNCAGVTNSGTLTVGVAASGVSSVVPYTGGNGGTYTAQSITSTGVTGLTATLVAGSFATGNGTLTYTITGTPSSGGTASFALNIGGRTCTLTRGVGLPVGTITGLNCAGAVNSGTLTAGTPASGVNSSIPYTGGNGGSHNGQSVTSTGVTGLTATLTGGAFANGNGTLTYTITGTPSAAGTASFALNIGGRTCTLTRTVNNAVVTVTTTQNDQVPSPFMCGGTVNSPVEAIVERGIIYGQSQTLDYNSSTLVGSFRYGSSYGGAVPTPTTGRITSGTGTGSFSVNIFYLFPATQYYFCAYAKTAAGAIVKGQVISITARTYKRSTAAPDAANVFWNSQFNLFDLQTDEIITPDGNGVYKFYYSSNEDPNVYYQEMTAAQLPNFRFYKFKTNANCLKWTQIKKGLIVPRTSGKK